ncbi:MAG: hypothetical protein H6696_04080 [Deferribacteres bacterium]|nr:hypothetical protein [candidate division KSB1 bacterium]MCB9501092.1 hypothetical protein [Deferribacteres bacterium]
MQSPDLISISLSAFTIVFIILSALAVVMQLIINFFPEKGTGDDLAVYSAIASVHSAIYPDKRITKIEEVK